MPTTKSEDKLPKRGARKPKGSKAKPKNGANGKSDEPVDLGVVSVHKPKSGRKQQFIPGTEPPHFEEIDAAATHYHAIKCERAALSTAEREARAMLLDVMKKHDVSVYKFEDEGRSFIARVKPGDDKAEVKEADGSDAGDSDEGDAG